MKNLSMCLVTTHLCHANLFKKAIAMNEEARLPIFQFDLGGISVLATSTKSENGEYKDLFHYFSQ
jgi:hypothetical protein